MILATHKRISIAKIFHIAMNAMEDIAMFAI
jgi:hypothetical protein